MSDKNPVTVLIPIELPADPSVIMEVLNRFINRSMEIILLHVVDTAIAQQLNTGGIDSVDTIFETLKQNAHTTIKEVASRIDGSVQSLIVEGVPFIEIIKISRDLKVDLIAMPLHANSQNLENLFFGSTTERVLRGSSVPVFCIK